MSPHPAPLPSRSSTLAGWLGCLALLAGACSDLPTGEQLPPARLAPEAEVAAFVPDLEDVAHRVAPALEDREAAAELGRRLSRLSAHLAAREADEAVRELALARRAVAAYGAGAPDGAELTVIEMTLDASARLLGVDL